MIYSQNMQRMTLNTDVINNKSMAAVPAVWVLSAPPPPPTTYDCHSVSFLQTACQLRSRFYQDVGGVVRQEAHLNYTIHVYSFSDPNVVE
jgi:hypothetical protein